MIGLTARNSVSRRRILATLGGVALAGVAGCSNVTEQSFEATTVALPEAAREELWLAETARDGTTIERDGPGGIEVEVTNKATIYSRAAWLEGK